MKPLPFALRDLEMKKFTRSPVLQFSKPWRVEIDGRRHYTNGAITVPSVTTVLSALDEGKLDWWYEALGEDKANAIVRRSANRGTQIHKLAENYVTGKDLLTTDEEVPAFNSEALAMYKGVHRVINEHIDNIRLSEGMLISQKLGIAGTLDLFADWDGEPAIIDFKNARRLKSDQELLSYFIQETFYAVMVKETFGITAKKIVTISAVEGGGTSVVVKETKDYFAAVLDTMARYKLLTEKRTS